MICTCTFMYMYNVCSAESFLHSICTHVHSCKLPCDLKHNGVFKHFQFEKEHSPLLRDLLLCLKKLMQDFRNEVNSELGKQGGKTGR